MDTLSQAWPLLGVSVLAGWLYIVYLYFFHPLSHYPGPFLAKFTDYWRYRDVRGRRSHETMIALHERYGPVVRTGPNTLSIGDPAYIPKIYGPGHGFLKSAFYHPLQAWVGSTIGYNLFTTRDAHFHSAIKHPVASAYGFQSALELEPVVSDCITTFVRRLGEDIVDANGKEKKACDLASWMQFYAFDVIAIMTWGKAFGFLDRGEDVNHMIQRLDARLDTIASMSQMPWIDWLKNKNQLVSLFKDKTNAFARLAASLIQDRQACIKTEGVKPGPRLFIDRFLDAQRAYPKIIDDRAVIICTTSNVVAGSDTVAIALRTIMYMVLRHPLIQARLLTEIDAASLSFPVTWTESQQLPYLDAVIQESLRIHPPVGMVLERVVPAEGLTMLDGKRIPAGVQVGVHPWAVHLLDSVWGPEPKEFRPERWLQGPTETVKEHQARVATMKRTSLAFRAGSRQCMGKHLSTVQIAKLIPSLFMKYRFELVEENRDWNVVCSWFVRQADIDVHIKRR